MGSHTVRFGLEEPVGRYFPQKVHGPGVSCGNVGHAPEGLTGPLECHFFPPGPAALTPVQARWRVGPCTDLSLESLL